MEQFKEEVVINPEGKSEYSGFKIGKTHDEKYIIFTHLDPDYYGNFNRLVVQIDKIPLVIQSLRKMITKK